MPPLPDACSLNLSLTSAEPRSANYLEVGGPDTAMLNAVGNTVSNVPGFVVPISGVFLRNLTGAQTLVHPLLDGAVAFTSACCAGSWAPLFAITAAIQFGTGLAFGRWASLESARETLRAKKAGGA